MWSVKGAVLYDKCWEAEEERYHLRGIIEVIHTSPIGVSASC